MVTDGGVDQGLGHQIHGVGTGIDDRGSRYAFLVETDRGAAREIYSAGRRAADVEHAGVPELDAGVGVNRVHRIHLRDHVDYVVDALSGNVHIRHIERLRHHHVIDGKAEEAAKAGRVDVGGSEQSLIGVGAAAGVISTTGQ